MENSVFVPADILLPHEKIEKWAVIACDQFTSQPEYWQQVCETAAGAASALHLIVPEAWLGQVDETAESERISRLMRDYMGSGVFQTHTQSYVYVRRQMTNGMIRHGLVGAVDLEQYDFTGDSHSAVRATEETILARLPARVEVRRRALLELPHIMLLSELSPEELFAPMCAIAETQPPVYDFDLMCDGGRIQGWLISEDRAQTISRRFIPSADGPVLIIGDGNHSLAAARQHWLRLREMLSADERATHPARFCLAELCSVYDSAVAFYPIHRVLFGVDARELSDLLSAEFSGGSGLSLIWQHAEGRYEVKTAFSDCAGLVEAVQRMLDAYTAAHGGSIDYVHGDDEALALGSKPGNLSVILPPLGRGELFTAAREGRVFPRKCFSIGHAREKRYYLEARKITR